MTLLELRDLRVGAAARPILDLTRLSVEAGEVLAVLGPTGAGKSTLLRVAGGLERPQRGSLRWRGEVLGWPLPLGVRRRITMAFQDPLLFGGTTLDNVLYGLALRHTPAPEAREAALGVMATLRIAERAQQRASTLSGGEAQRAALARALAVAPELLLLDEPLKSLDEPLREELRQDLLAAIRQRGLTCIWVTHDQAEAKMTADRVAVLDQGRLRQLGSPEEVFSRPVDTWVARFVGTTNLLAGEVAAARDGLVEVAVGGTRLYAVARAAPGTRVVACVRPDEVELTREAPPPPADERTWIPAEVSAVVDQGAGVAVRLAGAVPLVALIARPTARRLRPMPGDRLSAVIPHGAVHLIEERA